MTAIVQTSAGPVEVRGLKHGEVKKLRLRQRLTDQEISDELMEEVVQAALLTRLQSLDDLYYSEVSKLFTTVLELTFLTGEARKNWNSQPDSGPPVS